MSVRDEKQTGVHKLRCDRSTMTYNCTTFPWSPSCMTSLHHCYCQRIFTRTQAHYSSFFSSLCPCSFWDEGLTSLRTHGARETRRLKDWGIGGVGLLMCHRTREGRRRRRSILMHLPYRRLHHSSLDHLPPPHTAPQRKLLS